MAFLIGGANSADTGFNISNSCRFNDVDDPKLSRATGDGNEDVGTFSFWWKLSDTSALGSTFYRIKVDASNFFVVSLDGGGNFQVGNKASGSYNLNLESTATYRDPSAWYHFVVRIDTTQAVEANRARMYVNGTQITDLQGTPTYPDQNEDMIMNSDSKTAEISASVGDSIHGYLAEFVLIDGTSLAPSSFGETDEDSGIWKPISVSGLTKGTNGFYLDFEDADNLGNCAYGGTDFTESNLAATDQCTDTPTNNFCTLNPLDVVQDGAFSEGNCYVVTNSSNRNYVTGTMAVNKGKWYWESKLIAVTSDATDQVFTGVADLDDRGVNSTGQSLGDRANEVGWHQEEGKYQRNNSWSDGSSAGDSADWTINDIISIALDMDNDRVTIAKNGQWADGSGNADEASPTSYVSVTNSYMTAAFGEGGGSTEATFSVNFGNPPFSISSGNADANGYGNFEYAVPSGFYALCTKNLAEYG